MGKDSHFTGQPVYSKVLNLLDKSKILQISRETAGSEAYVKRFDGYQHLVVMLFGVLKHLLYRLYRIYGEPRQNMGQYTGQGEAKSTARTDTFRLKGLTF